MIIGYTHENEIQQKLTWAVPTEEKQHYWTSCETCRRFFICFALFCLIRHQGIHLPILFRVVPPALGQSYDCPVLLWSFPERYWWNRPMTNHTHMHKTHAHSLSHTHTHTHTNIHMGIMRWTSDVWLSPSVTIQFTHNICFIGPCVNEIWSFPFVGCAEICIFISCYRLHTDRGGIVMATLWAFNQVRKYHITSYVVHSNSYPFAAHDDVIKWKHFPRYWSFVRVIHRTPVNSPHKGQWRGALMYPLICARINGWVNNREAGDLRRHLPHYDAIVMLI